MSVRAFSSAKPNVCAGDVSVIQQVFRDQATSSCRAPRRRRSRFQRNVLMTLLRGERPIRVNRSRGRASALCLLRARPEMQVRLNRVGAPDEDDLAFLEKLGEHADARAVGGLQASGAQLPRRSCGPVLATRPACGRTAARCCRPARGPSCPRSYMEGWLAARGRLSPQALCSQLQALLPSRSASKRPSPLRPTRFMGVVRRCG